MSLFGILYAFVRKQVFSAVKVQCLDDDLNWLTIVQAQRKFVTISEPILNTTDNLNRIGKKHRIHIDSLCKLDLGLLATQSSSIPAYPGTAVQ
jgi:hypothetical protein